MSGNWERHADSDKELATRLEQHRKFGGNGHDRIHGDNPIPGVSSTIAMTGDNDDIEVDITAGQKMMSAMSGSLLTSLLGMWSDILKNCKS
jgi:solute carrier family 25 protein 39/40